MPASECPETERRRCLAIRRSGFIAASTHTGVRVPGIAGGSIEIMASAYQALIVRTGGWLGPFALLALRLAGAKVFWDSGMTKWDGFLRFDKGKYDLFLYEFFCPDPPRPGALQLCDPATLEYTEGSAVVSMVKALAVMAGIMEVALPVLLVLGLLSRLAAFGLLGMTLFIQLAVFPTWSHWWNPAMWWAVVLLALVACGPGAWSLDRLLGLEDRRNP